MYYHSFSEVPLWVSVEVVMCYPLCIDNLSWLPPLGRRGLHNPITGHLLRLREHVKGVFNLISGHSPLLSFLGNLQFYPVWSTPTCRGFMMIHALADFQMLWSFPTLQKEYHLPAAELFCYLQIKNFVLASVGKCSDLLILTQFEWKFLCDPHAKGLLSLLYVSFLTLSHPVSPICREMAI